jgi:hypothetical protein
MTSMVRTGAAEVHHDFSPKRIGATTAYGLIFGVTNTTSVISMMALVFPGISPTPCLWGSESAFSRRCSMVS